MSRKRIICILICLLLFLGMLYFISTRNKSSSTATGSEVSTATTQMQQTDEGKKVAEPATEAKNLIAEEQTQNSIQAASTKTSQNQEEAVKEETTKNETVTSAQEVSKEEAPVVKEEPKTEQNPPAVTEEKAPVANESETTTNQEKAVSQKEQENEAAKDVADEKTANQEATKEQTSQKELSEKSKEIELEIKDILRLNKIEFETASAVITPKGEAIIVKIAEVLKKYPNIKVEIAGHTDKAGNKKFNQKLSQDRANSVKEALIKLDIDSSRLVAKGYGDSKPLVKRNEEDIQQNRRVEFHIIEE